MAFFRKKQAITIEKVPPSISRHMQQYHDAERLKSPKEQWQTLRRYYVAAIILALIGAIQTIAGLAIVEFRNSNAQPNLVRVDGVRVEEAFDQRREILMASSLRRAELKKQSKALAVNAPPESPSAQ